MKEESRIIADLKDYTSFALGFTSSSETLNLFSRNLRSTFYISIYLCIYFLHFRVLRLFWSYIFTSDNFLAWNKRILRVSATPRARSSALLPPSSLPPSYSPSLFFHSLHPPNVFVSNTLPGFINFNLKKNTQNN